MKSDKQNRFLVISKDVHEGQGKMNKNQEKQRLQLYLQHPSSDNWKIIIELKTWLCMVKLNRLTCIISNYSTFLLIHSLLSKRDEVVK